MTSTSVNHVCYYHAIVASEKYLLQFREHMNAEDKKNIKTI